MFKSSVFAKNEIYGNATARFVRAYDGDTITVHIPDYPNIIGKEISVRIYGIDTPEKRDSNPEIKEMARTAQRLVENLCKRAAVIELRNIRRDKYFRILAEVYVDGKSLADLLIKNNLAKVYDGGTKNVWTTEDYKKYQNTNR